MGKVRSARAEVKSAEDKEAPVSGRTDGQVRAMPVGARTAVAMSVAVAAQAARQPMVNRLEDTPLGGIYHRRC